MKGTRGAVVASAMAAVMAFSAAPPVSAALLWTLTASPLAVTTGTPTTFTLTAANLLLGGIECVVVDVPANFTVSGVSVLGSTAGDSWLASRSGNRVTVWTPSGGDRLELLDNVRFTVSATALNAQSLAWSANAYDDDDCDESGSLLTIPPVVVVTGPAVTPTPLPTPPPTPVPTSVPPTPTPTSVLPLPSASLPVPLPSIGPSGTPVPTLRPGEASHTPSSTAEAAASRSPAASADDRTEGSPGRSSAPGLVAAPGGAGAGAQAAAAVESGPTEPRMAFDDRDLDLGVGLLGLIGGIEIWAVPAATIAVPGLLVLLWAALQALGALAWVPAARRLRGNDRSARGSSRRS